MTDGTTRGAWLAGLEQGYPIVLCLLIASVVLTAITLAAAGRRSHAMRRRLIRILLAGVMTMLGLALAEAVTGGYLAWVHRQPRLAMATRPRSGEPGENVSIVVVGESSAEGVPYKDWLSVGKIVAWQLRRIIPQRMFHVEVQARAGWTLEQMHQKLAELPRPPDAVIVYAGHNEFASRYGWSDSVPYYEDDPPATWPKSFVKAVAARSPLCRWIAEASARERIAARPPAQHRPMVDVPSCTPAQYEERLTDFRCRLESILSDLRKAGVLTILIAPPGNDAGFEPSRSILPPKTPRDVREAFTEAMARARSLEQSDPRSSARLYRDLIAQQPGFAEAHFRLARLLERAGARDEAYREYVLARDLDGHPMRCPTRFQDVYRQLAPAYDAILVDGQAVMHAQGPGGLLDDQLFNDAMHPSLSGHALLAGAVLAGLKEQQALGWPVEVPVPAIDPALCAEHFDVSTATWKAVCRFAAGFYRATMPIRFDASEREAKARRYEAALERLGSGGSTELADCPGIGIQPGHARPGHFSAN